MNFNLSYFFLFITKRRIIPRNRKTNGTKKAKKAAAYRGKYISQKYFE